VLPVPEALHHFTVLYHTTTHIICGNKCHSHLQDTYRNFTPQTGILIQFLHDNINSVFPHYIKINYIQNYVGPTYNTIHETVHVALSQQRRKTK
jgi:hypothetical protein